jgi:hypothetical protein
VTSLDGVLGDQGTKSGLGRLLPRPRAHSGPSRQNTLLVGFCAVSLSIGCNKLDNTRIIDSMRQPHRTDSVHKNALFCRQTTVIAAYVPRYRHVGCKVAQRLCLEERIGRSDKKRRDRQSATVHRVVHHEWPATSTVPKGL